MSDTFAGTIQEWISFCWSVPWRTSCLLWAPSPCYWSWMVLMDWVDDGFQSVVLPSALVRYSAVHGQVINMCSNVLSYSANTPERHEILKQKLLWNFGLRSLWSGVVSPNKLPFCKQCFEKACTLSRNSGWNKTVPACGNCCGWRFDEVGRQFDHTPMPDNYPTSDKSDPYFEYLFLLLDCPSFYF